MWIKVLFLDIDGVENSFASAVENNRREVLASNKVIARRKKNKKAGFPDRDYYRIMTGRREISNLNFLMKEVPDLRIVVSSTWRKNRTLKQMQEIMKIAGFKYPDRVIDLTPVIYVDSGKPQDMGLEPVLKDGKPVLVRGKPKTKRRWHQPCHQVRRGLEIAAWLDVAFTDKKWDVLDYCIVDDDTDMVFLKHKFVHTDANDGLTMAKVTEIMNMLGENRRIDHMALIGDKRKES